MNNAEALADLAAYIKRGRPSDSKLLKRARKLGIRIEDVGELRALIKLSADKAEAPVHMESDKTGFSAEAEVKTLDDLLTVCGADTSKWEVVRWEANVWGKTHQVKAKFERALSDLIHPARSDIRLPRQESAPRGERGRVALILPDSQIGYSRDLTTNKLKPFHDREVMDIWLQVAEMLQPDDIVLLGDMLDCTEWGKYLVEPDKRMVTQPAIDEGHWWFAGYRQAAPSANITYFEGNHEKRIQRALAERLNAAVGLRRAGESQALLELDYLLKLDQLDIPYVPYGDVRWLWDKVSIQHGVYHGKNAVEKTFQRSMRYSLLGHIHRMDLRYYSIQSPDGPKMAWSCSPGCGCHTDGRVPAFSPGEQDWHKGFAVLREVGDDVFIETFVIVDGRCVVNGQVLVGRDRTAEIRGATGWLNM